MAYTLPSPSVHQILLRSSLALTNSGLMPCVIGSLKQVIKDKVIELAYPVANTTISYPFLKPGAIIDSASVKMKIKNAIVQIATNVAAGANFVAGKNIVTIANAFAEVQAGDTIALSGNAGTYTIREVIDSSNIKLTQLINYSTSNQTFSITRVVPEAEVVMIGAVFSEEFFTLSSIEYAGKQVLGGKAMLSYVAARKDMTGFYEVLDLAQLEHDMDIDIANPLGYILGTLMPSAGGATRTVAYIIDNESEAAYMQALEALETRRDIYIVHALSVDSNVQHAIAAHIQSLSDPRFSMFRTGFVTADLTQKQTLASGQYVNA